MSEPRSGSSASASKVAATDPEGSSMVQEREDGRREMLDLAHLADLDVRSGYVRTIHSAYGAMFDPNMVHRAAFCAGTVDAHSAYVAFSRAREGAIVYTENRASLTKAFRIRDGAKIGASNEAVKGPAVTTAFSGRSRSWGWRLTNKK